MMEEIDGAIKTCPICCEELRLVDFGVCRARPDGRNLYCKSCIRKKVTNSRRALKEYRSARKRGGNQLASDQADLPLLGGDSNPPSHYPRMLSQLTPVERVREAIKSGARTQKEIRKGSQLSDDEVGDALANLLLWTREVRTELVDNTRRYFLNQPAVQLASYASSNVPQRKMDVPSSFSALQGLMPGKRPEGEREKIGGWVAA